MPAPSPRSAILLVSVAATMALLVGLVGSARRMSEPSRQPAPLEPWTPREPAETVLATPRPIADEEPAPAPPPRARPSPPRAEGPSELLTGLVLRPDGEPAAGAHVKLGGQRARCSSEGRFQLSLEARLEDETLVAHLGGFEPAVLARLGSSAGGAREVRLVLGPEALALTGTVVDPSGHPLKGWTVELDGPDLLRDHGLRETVRTDPEGRFVLSDVPAGVHVVRAWKARRELAVLSGPAAAGELGLTIVASDE